MRDGDGGQVHHGTGPASANFHRLLFEQMPNAAAIGEIVFDEAGRPADYRIVDVNPAFESLIGQKAD